MNKFIIKNKKKKTFADVVLPYDAPEQVGAAMAVRGFMKRFLSKAVPVADWSLGRDRRHVPRSTAAPFTPDFHREITLGAPRDHITYLCYFKTVSEHFAARSTPVLKILCA